MLHTPAERRKKPIAAADQRCAVAGCSALAHLEAGLAGLPENKSFCVCKVCGRARGCVSRAAAVVLCQY